MAKWEGKEIRQGQFTTHLSPTFPLIKKIGKDQFNMIEIEWMKSIKVISGWFVLLLLFGQVLSPFSRTKFVGRQFNDWLTDRSFLLSKTHSLWIKACCYLIAFSVVEKFRCLKFDSIGFETLVTSKRFLQLLNKQNLTLNEHLHRLTSTPLLWLELNNWSALDSLDSHYSSLLTQMQSDFESLERVFFFHSI